MIVTSFVVLSTLLHSSVAAGFVEQSGCRICKFFYPFRTSRSSADDGLCSTDL